MWRGKPQPRRAAFSPRWNDFVRARPSEYDDAADRLALVHEVETLVDVRERQAMGDQIVDVDLAVHVPVDDPRHIAASLRTAESRPFPHAASDELKRAGPNLLAGARDTNDHRYAPTLVAALE